MKNIHDNDELWALADIAKYLKLSKSTVFKNWKKMGLKPVIPYVGAKPRFWKSEIVRLLERPK